jgi:hypothetical protein
LDVGSSTATGAPTANPDVEPPFDSHPTQVPSARRTASENGSVWLYGPPACSTPPALPATAVPATTFGPPTGAVVAAAEVVVVEEVAVVDAVEAADVVVAPGVDDAGAVDADDGAGPVVVDERRPNCPGSCSLEHAASATAATTNINRRP